MTFEDWRNARPSDLASCYAEEVRRWRADLGWEFEPSIDIVERGRREGRVGGYISRDGQGLVEGWTYFVLHQRTLQIGALTAPNVEQIRGLLDCVLRAPEAESAHEITCFVYPQTPGLTSALERRRFTLTDFCYLAADVTRLVDEPRQPVAAELRPWRAVPGPAAVRLLARGYAGEPVARWFAPHGRLDEWAHYVGQLMHTPSCGTFLPEASFAFVLDGGHLGGLILATQLSATTAHVAQLVVDPDLRGRGIGRRLVAAAAYAARNLGCESCSLLVADDNAAARRLYESMGFAERGRFVSARRAPLRRQLLVDRPATLPSQRPKAS